MIKIILSGCNGKMGRVITQCAAERNDVVIVAGVDINTEENGAYPVYSNISEFEGEADAIIDFSHPSSLDGILKYSAAHGTPAVIATTGLSDAQRDALTQAAKNVPILFSANMSLGVNLIAELAKTAARVLYSDYDIEIIEKHHNQKLDAPSGTALMLADEICSVVPSSMHYEYDRHSKRQKRAKNEIGIHAVRGGTIVGEHEIIFAGEDEIITISHSARSKKLFAVGCINAAVFLQGKPSGLYDMKDFVENP